MTSLSNISSSGPKPLNCATGISDEEKQCYKYIVSKYYGNPTNLESYIADGRKIFETYCPNASFNEKELLKTHFHCTIRNVNIHALDEPKTHIANVVKKICTPNVNDQDQTITNDQDQEKRLAKAAKEVFNKAREAACPDINKLGDTIEEDLYELYREILLDKWKCEILGELQRITEKERSTILNHKNEITRRIKSSDIYHEYKKYINASCGTLEQSMCQIEQVRNQTCEQIYLFVQERFKGELKKQTAIDIVNQGSTPSLTKQAILTRQAAVQENKRLMQLEIEVLRKLLRSGDAANQDEIKNWFEKNNEKLKEVEELDLSGLSLNNISPQILELFAKFSHLKKLNLKNNQLENVPDFLEHFTQLTELDLGFNKISRIPTFLGDLAKLKVLDLGNNELKVISKFLKECTHLKTLRLNNNKIKNIPEWIGNLSELETLEFRDNMLESIPESIGKLSKLRFLSLSKNMIYDIPESIGNLFELNFLSLNDNCLQSIPKSIGNLAKLKKNGFFCFRTNRNEISKLESFFAK